MSETGQIHVDIHPSAMEDSPVVCEIETNGRFIGCFRPLHRGYFGIFSLDCSLFITVIIEVVFTALFIFDVITPTSQLLDYMLLCGALVYILPTSSLNKRDMSKRTVTILLYSAFIFYVAIFVFAYSNFFRTLEQDPFLLSIVVTQGLLFTHGLHIRYSVVSRVVRKEDDRIVKKFKALTVDEEGGLVDKSCMICLEKYSINECVSQIPCGHEFHTSCLQKWFKSKVCCPYCRMIVQYK